MNWMKRRGPHTYLPRETVSEPQSAAPSRYSGKYSTFYNYLHNRYADTVVLTFGQIESLLGVALPDQARLNRHWWTNAATAAGTDYSDTWLLAHRVATPNLLAQTVAFERAG